MNMFFVMALAASPVIPDIPNAKHEIGFACLKEIQNQTCSQPFTIKKVPPPAWAKKANGAVLTPGDWQKIETVMTGYEDGFGFKVYGVRKDTFELRIVDGKRSESVWIPKEKLLQFYPLSDYPVCSIGGAKWWEELRQNDLKTKPGFDLSKKIPGDPYKGIDPIGVLEVSRNNRSEICKGTACSSGKVPVDAKMFEQTEATGSRGSLKELNLGAEHFLGEDGALHELLRAGHLVVYDRRGSNEFLLKTVIYSQPQIWVKLTPEQVEKANFLPVGSPVTDRILASEHLQIQPRSKLLLKGASLSREDSKWQDGQFWYKVKVLAFDMCEDPELGEKTILGEFWVPYSNKLDSCPKGC
jgi:hypothetical protein